MEVIANLKEIKRGKSVVFTYKGQKALLIRTKKNDLVAYSAICPHEGNDLSWDEGIHRILCECHMSIFNAEDGSVYKHSPIIDLQKGLTQIRVTVDDGENIFVE